MAYAKLDGEKPGGLHWNWRAGVFWIMASHRQPNGFVLKLLTFVSTVSFWPFWGLMHLGMRKWRG